MKDDIAASSDEVKNVIKEEIKDLRDDLKKQNTYASDQEKKLTAEKHEYME